MAKTADIRPKITLACTQCKERNYITKKNRRNDPDRLELKKFCPRCKTHTPHRETRCPSRPLQTLRSSGSPTAAGIPRAVLALSG